MDFLNFFFYLEFFYYQKQYVNFCTSKLDDKNILWNVSIFRLLQHTVNQTIYFKLSIYLNTYICVSVCVSEIPPIYLSIYLSIYLNTCICVYENLSIYLNTYICVWEILPIYLSIYLSTIIFDTIKIDFSLTHHFEVNHLHNQILVYLKSFRKNIH